MNPLRALYIMAFLVATILAYPNQDNIDSVSLKPSHWLTPDELEELPSLNEITLEKLEDMPLEKGAKLMQTLASLAKIHNELPPSFVPSSSNVPVYIIMPNGEKQITTLNSYVQEARKELKAGIDEVTIIITGLPKTSEPVKKANKKLIQAYLQRYNQQTQSVKEYSSSGEQQSTSSEEDSNTWKNQEPVEGILIIIDLGSTITNFKRFALMDIDQTGKMVGKTLVDLTNDCNVPHEIIHVIAQGIGANVAGVAAKEYTRLTSHKLRRITALDPSKQLAKHPKVLTGLHRGDADFVDAIHTSVYGLGTLERVGDIDFFPDGPNAGMSGCTNVVEASMRATRYYAESVHPGNERNFPAVRANSLKQYKNNDGYGKRAYMGINTDFDLKGDYLLQVNPKSPFGMRTPAQKQNAYHGVYKPLSEHDE